MLKGIGVNALIPLGKSQTGEAVFQGLKCSKGRGIILPGGKWEEGETYTQTAIRETKEETGLIVQNPKFLYSGMSSDGFFVHTFVCYKKVPFQEPIATKEGTPVAATWHHLLSSQFAPYYEILKEIYEQCF
jgi:8-oxo-dGTP pyrophosphatase MutT (NUDIX family)